MQAMPHDTPPILGSWTHSFEEDEGELLVYRPTQAFTFPPARRARETLVFGADGELLEQMPGPDDRPRGIPGRWAALGMNRFSLERGQTTPSSRVIEVLEHTPDLLKIRKANTA